MKEEEFGIGYTIKKWLSIGQLVKPTNRARLGSCCRACIGETHGSMTMDDKYAMYTILTGLILFGSLFLTGITNNGFYFLFGYPVSIMFLLLAHKRKVQQ